MEYSVADRELMFRNLAGNQMARHVAERALQIEDEEEAKRKETPDLYPWMGFEWHAIPAQPAHILLSSAYNPYYTQTFSPFFSFAICSFKLPPGLLFLHSPEKDWHSLKV